MNNIKTIKIFNRSDIRDLPPLISQIIAFRELGYQVELITYYLFPDTKKLLDNNLVSYQTIGKNNVITRNYFKKVIDYFILKKFFKKHLKNVKDQELVLIGSAESMVVINKKTLRKTKNKKILNLFELPNDSKIKLKIIKSKVKFINEIIVPEYNRAFIVKQMLNLNYLPKVIPNIPYINKLDIKPQLLPEEILALVNSGYKIILYQGILHEERPLEPIARALKEIDGKYIFLIMSKYDLKVLNKLKEIYPLTKHINFINAPSHLDITKRAHLGLAIYDDSSLNSIFCAPNKIYEYAMYEIPTLARDMPGLKYTIGAYKAGVCVDIYDINSIIEGIKNIETNYLTYKENTKDLLASANVKELLFSIMENLK